MNRIQKGVIALVAAATLALGMAGCTSGDYQERKAQQDSVTLENSLGKQAQTERLSREEDTTTIRYVYIIDFGQVLGYYTIKGGVYGADTQLAPEQDIVCPWATSAESCNAVDSAKDNGTYGGGDVGVFFITSDDVLVETTLDYIQADAPITVYADVPLLNNSK